MWFSGYIAMCRITTEAVWCLSPAVSARALAFANVVVLLAVQLAKGGGRPNGRETACTDGDQNIPVLMAREKFGWFTRRQSGAPILSNNRPFQYAPS